ncbi:MAG: hypothetical protein WC247_15465 [Porticoccaceae bacterium]
MSRTSGRQRQSLWAIFRVPVLLAVLSIIGLVSALVGDELWDVLSWVMLGVPIVLIAWCLRPGRSACNL